MTNLTLAVDVKASQRDVFEYFTAWHRQNEWMLGTDVVVTNPQLDPQGLSVGSELSAFTGVSNVGFTDTMRITVFESPFRVDVLHTGRVVRGTGTMLVEATSPTTSRFVWSENLDLPFGIIGRVGFFFVRPFFAWAVMYSLKKFASRFVV